MCMCLQRKKCMLLPPPKSKSWTGRLCTCTCSCNSLKRHSSSYVVSRWSLPEHCCSNRPRRLNTQQNVKQGLKKSVRHTYACTASRRSSKCRENTRSISLLERSHSQER